MRTSLSIVLLRVLCLLAVTLSAALLVDYTNATPTFCDPGSGCSAVRGTALAYPLGVPLPAIGMAGFAALLVCSLVPRARRLLLVPLSLVAGISAIALLLVQAGVGKFCQLCVGVDVAAIVIAGLAFRDYRAQRRIPDGAPNASSFDLQPWAWLVAGALAAVLPVAWSRLRPTPPIPPAVAQVYVPGKINVVEFADFECPFCRALHHRLKPLVRDYGDRVVWIRLQKPLPRHPNAHAAARAAICGEEQGRGEAMADALFETKNLSEVGVRRLAQRLGLDLARYDRCFRNPATLTRIERESSLLKPPVFQGLPTIFIGDTTIVGAQPDEVFRDALERSSRQEQSSTVPGWLFALLVAAALGGLVWVGRKRPGGVPTSAPDLRS